MERFFDKIVTEEQAYWLGFLAADGNVGLTKSRGVVTLCLQEKDKDIVCLFRKSIKSEHPVSSTTKLVKGRKYKGWRIDVGSIRMACRLSEIGITPKKTTTLDWNKIIRHIPVELIRHFVRGYSDGDGCWSFGKSGWQWCVISGSKKFVYGMKSYLVSNVAMGNVSIYKRKKNFLLQWTGNKQVRRFYHYLYNTSTISMPRKRHGDLSYAYSAI